MHGSLPARLRLLRARRGLTQADASTRIGISRDTLSDLERGLRQPTMPTLAKIAEGYGVDVEELLEEPVFVEGKGEAPNTGQQDELDELTRAARAIKAQWRALLDYERITHRTREQEESDKLRFAELDRRMAQIKERVDELQPPLCLITYYNPDKPPRLEFYRSPSAAEEADLKEKYGDYEVVEGVFELQHAV
jgi:transcriptional regulator with XRE-family HTH domain